MKMKQNNTLEFHIPLILALLMTAAGTLPMMDLPYCSSETELMTDSILYMKNNGLGLIYNNGYVEFPNIFAIIYYGIASLPGTGKLIMHITAAVFSVISIITAYKFGKFFFSVQAGVMSASIMCVQNVFMAQTGLVLPQMMLNACILGGFYLYFREKYLGCSIMMSLAAMTDITGLAAAAFLLVSYLKIKYREWSTGKNILLAVPIFLWVAYESASLIICGKLSIRYHDTSIDNFAENLYFIFADQFRFVISGLVVILFIINKLRKNTQYFVKDMGQNCIGMIAVIYICNSLIDNNQSWNLTTVSLLSVLAGCCISTIPISYQNKYIITCGLIIASLAGIFNDQNINDASIKYKNRIKVDMKTASMINESARDGEHILCDQYFKKIFSLPELGYITNNKLKVFDIDLTDEVCTSMADWAVASSGDTLSYQVREIGNLGKVSSVYMNGYCNEIYRKK